MTPHDDLILSLAEHLTRASEHLTRLAERGIDGMSEANKRQVGGTHYLTQPIQPWDFIIANGLGFLDGNVVKYVARWRERGNAEDLEKARHYLDKLIEVTKGSAP